MPHAQCPLNRLRKVLTVHLVRLAVDNADSSHTSHQAARDLVLDLVDLCEVLAEVDLHHVRSATVLGAGGASLIAGRVVCLESHCARLGHIEDALHGQERAAEVQLVEVEVVDARRRGDVVAAVGQFAYHAEDDDVRLGVRVQALAFEDLLDDAEGVVGEVLVGADFLGGSRRVLDDDVVVLVEKGLVCDDPRGI